MLLQISEYGPIILPGNRDWVEKVGIVVIDDVELVVVNGSFNREKKKVGIVLNFARTNQKTFQIW
jgi:hypothetical protein